jgi:soluble lytic murein transglycosylase-like protein
MRVLAGLTLCAMAATAAADNASAPLESVQSTVAPAQHDIADKLARAVAYEHGEGIPKDTRIAAALYCEAAVQGNAEAAFQLGWMYANGRGVAHDDATAAALFELAAHEGHAFAGTARAHLGDAHGLLPDCMRPLAPPPIADAPLVADADEGADPFADLSPEKQKIAQMVYEVAPKYGIDPRLALAVITVESNFNVAARSVKHAQGLMQLVPDTASRFNVRNPYNARENLRGGLAYLRWLLAYYRGEVALAAAAYNAGERTVDRYGGVPPYPETREYVRRVLDLFRHPVHPFDPAVVDPSVIAARLAKRSE